MNKVIWVEFDFLRKEWQILFTQAKETITYLNQVFDKSLRNIIKVDNNKNISYIFEQNFSNIELDPLISSKLSPAWI